ncbi:hypothetical protein [Streptomyces sp. H27-D2]|uniref:hypothetical protein n=1 Tax=Streptomyces sp. H27-D2 TaxID=3046304 RepID=UPI002DBB4D59|nr:hypothetical protein [Streptomyces sp. H27-D2]MEC4015967.1 hypothetical protein [Streptomyces sp. H27-D2]
MCSNGSRRGSAGCELDERRPLLRGQVEYSKLIVPAALLVRQFADAGMELSVVGSAADLSPYHRTRIRERGDLGMLGEPDCFYRAVKA